MINEQPVVPPRATKDRLARQTMANLKRIKCDLQCAAGTTQQADHVWLREQLKLVEGTIEDLSTAFVKRTGIQL